jgi:isopentenyl diphosphate isomerase/L-lactate dehydrogenase-like FMN-dependent dehydrogenase
LRTPATNARHSSGVGKDRNSHSGIVTALAFGARAVLVGRAHLYGLAAAGEAGVRHAVGILAGELRTAMALCGAAALSDLDRDLLRISGPPRAAPPAAG